MSLAQAHQVLPASMHLADCKRILPWAADPSVDQASRRRRTQSLPRLPEWHKVSLIQALLVSFQNTMETKMRSLRHIPVSHSHTCHRTPGARSPQNHYLPHVLSHALSPQWLGNSTSESWMWSQSCIPWISGAEENQRSQGTLLKMCLTRHLDEKRSEFSYALYNSCNDIYSFEHRWLGLAGRFHSG